MLDLIKRVSGIGVDTQHNIRPARTDFLQHIQIPSRLYFDLDPPVSRRHLGLNLLHQLLGRILNPDRNPASNLAPRTAQKLPERNLFLPRLRIPHGVFKRALRHPMSANSSEPRRAISPRIHLALQQHWRQIALDGGPCSVRPFGAIKWIFPGNAFTPPPYAVSLDGHEQDPAAVDPPKARFKKMHERHMKFAKS